MKTVLLAACVTFVTVSISAQSNQSRPNDNNLYSLAMKTSILLMEKEYGQSDDSVMGERTFNKNTALFSMCNLSEFSMSVMAMLRQPPHAGVLAVEPELGGIHR